MKSYFAEVLQIFMAVLAAMQATNSPTGALKRAEALAEINKALDSPEGLHAPWWFPAGKTRDALLGFLIDQLAKLSFFKN